MPTVLELKEQRAQLWERMKEINDAAELEERDLTEEEKQNWDKAEADISALDTRIDRQEKLERKPAQTDNRQIATLAIPTQTLTATPEYSRAFSQWLREPRAMDIEQQQLIGKAFMQPSDLRAMGVNQPTAGGYLVPDEFQRRLEQALLWYGGMREAAEVLTLSTGADLVIPTSNDTSNTGELVGENTAVTEQDMTVGAVTIKAYMFSSKMVRVSFQMLQDSAVDVDSFIVNNLAERIGRITNTYFTTGTGANQPSGIAGDATSGVSGDTGQTTTVSWDKLIDLEHSIDPAYRRNGRYMFRDSTLQALRKLKDGEGRYLWQPGTTSGAPNTINNFPYTINGDVAAMAASAVSIFFGDLRKYKIVDVRPVTMLRLTERYAEYLQVAFLGYSRHGGALVDAGTHPVKYFANSAS